MEGGPLLHFFPSTVALLCCVPVMRPIRCDSRLAKALTARKENRIANQFG